MKEEGIKAVLVTIAIYLLGLGKDAIQQGDYLAGVIYIGAGFLLVLICYLWNRMIVEKLIAKATGGY